MIRQLVIDTIKDNIIDRYCDFSGTISRGAFWRFMLVEHLIVGVCLAVLGLLSLYSALFIYTIGIVFALWFISIMALTCLIWVLWYVAYMIQIIANGFCY